MLACRAPSFVRALVLPRGPDAIGGGSIVGAASTSPVTVSTQGHYSADMFFHFFVEI